MRVAANGAAPPGAEASAVTRAFRRAPGGAVRGQDPPDVNFATCLNLRIGVTGGAGRPGQLFLVRPRERRAVLWGAAFREGLQRSEVEAIVAVGLPDQVPFRLNLVALYGVATEYGEVQETKSLTAQRLGLRDF